MAVEEPLGASVEAVQADAPDEATSGTGGLAAQVAPTPTPTPADATMPSPTPTPTPSAGTWA